MHEILALIEGLGTAIAGSHSRLYPAFIGSMLIICFFLYLKRGHKSGFLAWVFPKRIYTHPSHMTDIKLLVFGKLLAVSGLFNVAIVNIAVIYYVQKALGEAEMQGSAYAIALVALIYLVTADFCTYWVHRIHHEWKVVWPFHAVHHSAEVMTPITVYRKHPFYDLFSGVFRGVIIGVVQGVILSVLVGTVSIAALAGVSALYFVFNLVGSNLRHSHIWMSFGPVLEHIFISPAQHQIHHSLEFKHWHKNYGEIFAVWDWMFGTLYVPAGIEDLQFGLSDEQGRRITQPHTGLTDALCKPVRECLAELRGNETPLGNPAQARAEAQ